MTAARMLLSVGSIDLEPRDVAVLRSLLQVLDGQMGCSLRYQDDALASCAVVFVPAAWPKRLQASSITVRVGDADDGDGFSVPLPLRLPAVRAVLEVASDLVANSRHAAASEGVRAVFLALTRHMMARERRITVLPLSDGNRLVVDFAKGIVYPSLARPALRAGMYLLETPFRAQPADGAALDAAPAWSLRELVWDLAAYLGEVGVEGSTFEAQYRLVRAPEPSALVRREHQRLAALLTVGPLGLADACQRSGVSAPMVQWFLEACLALGLVAPVGR